MDLQVTRRLKSGAAHFVGIGPDSGAAPPRRRESMHARVGRRGTRASRTLGFRVWEFGVYIPVDNSGSPRMGVVINIIQ